MEELRKSRQTGPSTTEEATAPQQQYQVPQPAQKSQDSVKSGGMQSFAKEKWEDNSTTAAQAPPPPTKLSDIIGSQPSSEVINESQPQVVQPVQPPVLLDFDERFRPTAPMTPLQAATYDHEQRFRRFNKQLREERDRGFISAQTLYAEKRKEVAAENRLNKKVASEKKRAEAQQRAAELMERLRIGREVAGVKAIEKIRRRMGIDVNGEDD